MELSIAAVLVLGALVALRWGVLLVLASLILKPARRCPACFADTVLLHSPKLLRLLPRAQWRWCPACRWEGPSLKCNEEPVIGEPTWTS